MDEFVQESVGGGMSVDSKADESTEVIAVTGSPELPNPEMEADTEGQENIPPLPEEVEIIGVRFRESGKIYYFDPVGEQFAKGAAVIVETARGVEFGCVVVPNRIVSGREIVQPLRRVVRAATEEDRAHHEENAIKEIEAYNICVEKIARHRLDMKLVDVEYTFDNNKLHVYFTADGRIDFRDLVKDLASVFRTRIELRQIGIRDEAKMMGGLGICGRPFCCHSFLSDFVQVSIKMAKEQSLSLNSSKISGSCGRLMCCLRYEYETYEEELRKTPKVDAVVTTPDGDGIVIETMPLAGLIKVRSLDAPDQTPKVYHRNDCTVKGRREKQNSPSPEAEADSPEREAVTEKERAATEKNADRRGDRNRRNRSGRRKNEGVQPAKPHMREASAAGGNAEKEPRAGKQNGNS